MPSPFIAAKTKARRSVHQRFASLGVYCSPAIASGAPLVDRIGFTVRWHDKLAAQVGDLENAGYAQIFEGVDTLVFSTDELSVAGFVLARNGTVTLPDYQMTLRLDTQMPTNGPIAVVWNVVRAPYAAENAVPLSMVGGGIGGLPDGASLGFLGL